MYDETGSKKPPNFFPGNSLHRADLLEPGLFSYRRLSAVRCSVRFVTRWRASLGGSGK